MKEKIGFIIAAVMIVGGYIVGSIATYELNRSKFENDTARVSVEFDGREETDSLTSYLYYEATNSGTVPVKIGNYILDTTK